MEFFASLFTSKCWDFLEPAWTSSGAFGYYVWMRFNEFGHVPKISENVRKPRRPIVRSSGMKTLSPEGSMIPGYGEPYLLQIINIKKICLQHIINKIDTPLKPYGLGDHVTFENIQ